MQHRHGRSPRDSACARYFSVTRWITVAIAIALCAGSLTGCLRLVKPRHERLRADPNVAPGVPVSQGSSASAEPTFAPLPLAGKVLPPRKGAYLGVYTPPAPFDVRRLDAFERQGRKGVSIAMWYQPWARGNRSQFDAGACAAIMRRGKVPLITWEPWDPGSDANQLHDASTQPSFRLSRIIDGSYDSYIRTWARSIRSLGGPVMLRPLHEMNGNWYPWGGTVNGNKPAEFRAAWRHIHDIFENEGATNVTWVWSINHESTPGTKANAYAAYYPGDHYVDWTGISGFNWGTTSPYSSWRTWSHWYAEPLAYLRTLHKPICIAEFASVEQGGDKAAWLRDAYARMRAYPGVKAVVYYDSLERGRISTQDWRVATSSASLASFRSAIKPTYFISHPPAALRRWMDSLTDADTQQLTSFPSVY